MILLGIDLGKVRTGISVCDPSEVLATPVAVIRATQREKLLSEIQALAVAHRAEGFVVGLPLNMDGSSGESARNARAFAQELESLVSLPVFLQDERGTTVTAHGFLSETNTRGKKRKEKVDAAAAAIILQNHLEMRRLAREREKQRGE